MPETPDLNEILQMAQNAELDLVEVSPMADPPVCRIMDFGKFLFEQNKKAQSARRNIVGWALVVIGPAALTGILNLPTGDVGLPTALLLFLALTVAVALVAGLWQSILSAVVGFVALNYFFTPPTGRLTIAEPENVLALVVFVLVAIAVASVVDLAARRQAGEIGRAVRTVGRKLLLMLGERMAGKIEAEHFLFRRQALAKRGVETRVAGPGQVGRSAQPILQVVDVQLPGELHGGLVESLCARLVARERPAVDAVGSGDQRIAEQPAGHVDERQHAGDAIVAPGLKEMTRVAEAALDHLFPTGAMEKTGAGRGLDAWADLD